MPILVSRILCDKIIIKEKYRFMAPPFKIVLSSYEQSTGCEACTSKHFLECYTAKTNGIKELTWFAKHLNTRPQLNINHYLCFHPSNFGEDAIVLSASLAKYKSQRS